MWESEEARDRFFSERLAPAYRDADLDLGAIRRTEFEIEMLAGIPQA